MNQATVDVHRFRSQMPVVENWVYLDHAAVGPLPLPTKIAVQAWLDQATADGDVFWLDWLAETKKLRATAASMIYADESEIALVPSTTTGINIVAEGFPWKSGDNVVLLENEFPSNLFPWMNLQHQGVAVRKVPVDGGIVDPQLIDDACDDRTRVVAASWVGYASGWRIDAAEIAEIAHRNSAFFFLDAIQGMGVFPLDVRGCNIDFLAADGHKWMLGPEGAGIFFVRRELLSLLRPLGIGWNSVKKSYDYANPVLELKESAARYEGGTMNMAGFIGLAASLKMLTELGVGPWESQVAESVLSISQYAYERLSEVGAKMLSPRVAGHESGIVTFGIPGMENDAIRNACRQAGIVVSCRGGGIRLSSHGYISLPDIDRLVDVVHNMRDSNS